MSLAMSDVPHVTAETSPDRRLATMTASAVISLAMHGAAFAAALLWLDGKPGAIDLRTDAISVELFHTDVIESLTDQLATSAPAIASAEIEAGNSAHSATAARTEEVQESIVSPSEVANPVESIDKLDVIEGESISDIAAPLEAKRSNDKRAERSKRVKPVKAREPEDAKARDRTPSKKGGQRSRSANGSQGASGRVSASTGSALNYAAIVRARVAGRKPAGGGRRGTVVVAFGVTRSGGLSYASIARSSGDRGLDSSVLSAVRGAGPFPAPPPGAQLRFAMPFYFR
jgi:protein TonB